MAVQQTPDGRWYIAGRPGYFPDDPKRTRLYLGRGPVAEASARARDDEIRASKTVAAASYGPTLGDLAIEYLRRKDFSEIQRGKYITTLGKTILPILGDRAAATLAPSDIDKYISARRAKLTLKGTQPKNNSLRREITIIKAILSWSSKQNPPLLAYHPLATYQMPSADDEVIIPPSPAETMRIYNVAAPHLRRVIMLAWYLGVRPGAVELLSLDWASSVQCTLLPAPWDPPDEWARKYAAIDGAELDQVGYVRIVSANKGGPEIRDVPVHSDLFRHLRIWHEQDHGEGFLISYMGSPVRSIYHAWRLALARAGIIRRLRPYDLRHAWASSVLEAGGDIGAVAACMGSRPETVRKHYQHVSQALTRRTVGLVTALPVQPVQPGGKAYAGKKQK